MRRSGSGPWSGLLRKSLLRINEGDGSAAPQRDHLENILKLLPDDCGELNRMFQNIHMHPKKCYQHLFEFVKECLPKDLIQLSNIDLDNLKIYLQPSSPVVFLIDSSSNYPGDFIKKIGSSENIRDSKIKYFSLGSVDSIQKIISVFREALIRGQWLILEGLEMRTEVAEVCYKLLNDTKSTKTFHNEFQLWISFNNGSTKSDIQPYILQMSGK